MTHTDAASQLGGHRGDKQEGNPPCSHRPGLCQLTPEGGQQGGQHLGPTTGALATILQHPMAPTVTRAQQYPANPWPGPCHPLAVTIWGAGCCHRAGSWSEGRLPCALRTPRESAGPATAHEVGTGRRPEGRMAWSGWNGAGGGPGVPPALQDTLGTHPMEASRPGPLSSADLGQRQDGAAALKTTTSPNTL